MADSDIDITIVGAGIVGLSTAMQLRERFPRLRTVVLEKEASVARHQSGRNSGVIHSGIYYKPGSFKAKMCVEGAAAMATFCKLHNIPYETCGKVVVATSEEEIPKLEELLRRGIANGVPGVRKISFSELKELEPNCSGIVGLHVPSTGITDYRKVCAKFEELLVANGGQVRLSSTVLAMRRTGDGFALDTSSGEVTTRYVINCAGLHSDRVARLAGETPDTRIIPFRGEYYDLIPDRASLVRNLIYPVPDARFPFLGVHFTRRISGSVDAGPNAVLACKREGYQRHDFSCRDTADALRFPGLWRMAARYWRSGLGEFHRSFRKSAFVRALQRLVPAITAADLVPGSAGVRAQAILSDGSLVDDFYFSPSRNILNVFNVPSPAATASIPIGRAIVAMASQSFNL